MQNAPQPKPDWWPRRLLNEHEVAELLNVDVQTLQGWRSRRTRDLPFCKIGARVAYNPDAVWAWLVSRTIQPAAV